MRSVKRQNLLDHSGKSVITLLEMDNQIFHSPFLAVKTSTSALFYLICQWFGNNSLLSGEPVSQLHIYCVKVLPMPSDRTPPRLALAFSYSLIFPVRVGAMMQGATAGKVGSKQMLYIQWRDGDMNQCSVVLQVSGFAVFSQTSEDVLAVKVLSATSGV